MSVPKDDVILKICLTGSSELKTVLARRVAELKFSSSYVPTIGVDITTKRIIVDGHRIKLLLVDTAYQEYFGKIRSTYYEGGFAVIIFFEKHDDDSFAKVPFWIEEVRRRIGEGPIVVLVGIITEQPEKVRHVIARKYALYWGLEFYAIKSTDEYSFEDLLKDITKRYLEKQRTDAKGKLPRKKSKFKDIIKQYLKRER